MILNLYLESTEQLKQGYIRNPGYSGTVIIFSFIFCCLIKIRDLLREALKSTFDTSFWQINNHCKITINLKVFKS